jgi:hypothetical protein
MRTISALEISVIRFALECQGCSADVSPPDETDCVVEAYPGYIEIMGRSGGSKSVGAALAISDGDRVGIDVFCDSDNRVKALAYVSMMGIEPPRFPRSLVELICDQAISSDDPHLPIS